MTAGVSAKPKTGLLGPVSVWGGILLLVAAPVMRGSNRYVALIALEILGLFVLLTLASRFALASGDKPSITARPALALLLLAPLLLALFQLTPLPLALWAKLPGHAIYLQALEDVGASALDWRALSLHPAATQASLLAGIPVAAAFLLGYLASLRQLRLIVRVVAAIAFLEVLLGLGQISGGQHSPLFFGMLSFGPPIGSFANRNHFANYLAMALVAYVWLAFESMRATQDDSSSTSFGSRHRVAVWTAGGLLLLLGIVASRSRGAIVFGLPMAALALGVVAWRLNGWTRGLRVSAALVLLLVVGAAVLVGLGAVGARFSAEQLLSSAGFRAILTRSTIEGAMTFWPWGAGWGTYEFVYPRFQPVSIAGYADHAHQDYAQMLFEGGVFFAGLAGAFLWLAGARAVLLAKSAFQHGFLDRGQMASAVFGLGLLGLLLHSLVEFNMRIPANAILGALMTGAYLRPLDGDGTHSDRSS